MIFSEVFNKFLWDYEDLDSYNIIFHTLILVYEHYLQNYISSSHFTHQLDLKMKV